MSGQKCKLRTSHKLFTGATCLGIEEQGWLSSMACTCAVCEYNIRNFHCQDENEATGMFNDRKINGLHDSLYNNENAMDAMKSRTSSTKQRDKSTKC